MSWDKERIAPVSYTHLDVYKRQGSRRYSFPIRQTMIRTLGCSWKVAAYTQGRVLRPCSLMGGTRLPGK